MSTMIRSSRQKAAALCNSLSSNQPSSLYSTMVKPRKLLRALTDVPQASIAFAFKSEKLVGLVRMPSRFRITNYGQTYWDSWTILPDESKRNPRWIPVLYQGEMAEYVATQFKDTNYAFIPGRIFSEAAPFDKSGDVQAKVESEANKPATTETNSSETQNHNVIPLLPLKNSIFVHDTLLVDLMFLVK